MVKQSAIDLPTVTRSYARTGYFDPIAKRTNLNLLTGFRVNELLLDSNKRVTGIRMQERGSTGGEGVIEVKADVETILCAGALHSPQVLQRSGIGPPSILNGAGIETKVYVHSAHREWIALRAQGMVGGVVVIVKVVSYTYFVKDTCPALAPISRTIPIYPLDLTV